MVKKQTIYGKRWGKPLAVRLSGPCREKPDRSSANPNVPDIAFCPAKLVAVKTMMVSDQ